MLFWSERAHRHPFAGVKRAALRVRSNFGVVALGCLAKAALFVNLLDVLIVQQLPEGRPLHRIHLQTL
jgi:hypothetical protein